MIPSGSFDSSKHPRGWHGRFSGGSGRSSAARATTGRRPVQPHPLKRLHAVVPVKVQRPAAPGLAGGLGAATSGFGRMLGD